MRVTMREALNQALDEELANNDKVFLIGEEVGDYQGAYKVSKGLLDKWGKKRIIDTPISEAGFSGLAIGAAMCGLKPVVEFMSFNFSLVAADQLISTACKQYYMSGGRFSVPIVFRGPNGAASQVSCQHSHCVESIYGIFPGFVIVNPSNPYDAKGLLKRAIRANCPVIFLESELDYGMEMEIPEKEYLIPFSSAKVLQEGDDVTLISYGRMIKYCKEALADCSFSVELIDIRTIKPMDIATIVESIRKTKKAVVVEEGHSFSGIASEIGFLIMNHCFDFLDAPIVRVCQKETPMPYSKVLEYATLPNKERILDALEQVMR